MESEPTRLFSLINAALVATLGILVYFDVIAEAAVTPISLGLAAWVAVAGELLRNRVTPINEPVLTESQVKLLRKVPD